MGSACQTKMLQGPRTLMRAKVHFRLRKLQRASNRQAVACLTGSELWSYTHKIKDRVKDTLKNASGTQNPHVRYNMF